MGGSHRRYILFVAVFLLVLLFFLTRLQYTSVPPLNAHGDIHNDVHKEVSKGSTASSEYTPICPEWQTSTLEYRGIKLSPKINYVRRCIKPKYDDSIARYNRGDGHFVDRVVNVSGPLITETTLVDLKACDFPEYTSCDTIELPVQRPYPKKKFDEFAFGVATTYERLEKSIPELRHWLADSSATLIALVADKEDEVKSKKLDFSRLVRDFADAGMTLKIARPHGRDHSVEKSHMMVIRDVLSHIDVEGNASETRWLGILDDDTFFPSLYPLSEALSGYNHTIPTYLGTVSENLELSQIGGPGAAYGGAGIFLSVPLAREIAPHLDSCLSERGGDMQIMECIHDHSHARLLPVPGLQQTDMASDVSGFFESGRRFLSLHHWKSWFHEPVEKQAAVVNVCGDCYLQRYSFDDNTILTNGFSINVYPNGYPDFTRVEATWDYGYSARSYHWSMGPLRPPMSKKDKLTYKVVDAFTTKDGTFRQIFVRKGDREKKEVDKVIDLLWQV